MPKIVETKVQQLIHEYGKPQLVDCASAVILQVTRTVKADDETTLIQLIETKYIDLAPDMTERELTSAIRKKLAP